MIPKLNQYEHILIQSYLKAYISIQGNAFENAFYKIYAISSCELNCYQQQKYAPK